MGTSRVAKPHYTYAKLGWICLRLSALRFGHSHDLTLKELSNNAFHHTITAIKVGFFASFVGAKDLMYDVTNERLPPL